MKIVKLTIHNFLKIKDIEMNPSQTNIIVGKNKQGKTSILKAIRVAFTGDADSSAIRIGESAAEIRIELEDLNIRRTITDKNVYLDISNKEGFKVPAPQKLLDGILGTFSFNPIEFFEKKPIERKKYLLNAIKMTTNPKELFELIGEDIVGYDFDYSKHALEVIEEAHKLFYDKRTAANSEVTKKQKTILELESKLPKDFDPSKFNETRVKELRDEITTNEGGKIICDNLNRSITDSISRIEKFKAEIVYEENKLKESQRKLSLIKIVDTTILEKELADLEAQRDLVYTHKQIESSSKELSEINKYAEKLDTIVKKLSKDVPQELITKAKLPVEGLTITANDILINEVSLDNLSASEQLKFGLEIVRKLNDKFKIICIDGIETLDKESFEAFLIEIGNDDYQYFVTRVNGTTKNGIVIENGEIKSEQK